MTEEATNLENTEEVEQKEETSEPTVNKITVENPSKEEMAQILEHTKINYDFDVDVKPVEFRFKKTKDKETGIETVRDTVELPIPYPSVQGIVSILEEGGLQLELLQEAMADVVNSQARELLYDDVNLNASNFPVEKVSWEFISKLPKAQRRGGGIPKETWEAFVEDYVSIMPEATGKTVEQCANAAKILMNKLAQVKTNEAVLNLMVEMLGIYTKTSQKMEEFSECVEFLLKKADTFLNLTEEDLLANL